jgi:hypothetical protein
LCSKIEPTFPLSWMKHRSTRMFFEATASEDATKNPFPASRSSQSRTVMLSPFST